MRILHTEASNGWGGQEIRILREAEGMRKRGHEVFFAIVAGGQLAARAREAGFVVYEFPMDRWHAIGGLIQLIRIIKRHRIELINTHSSFDAWSGGIAGRLTGTKIIRTRHLSTKVRPGFNARLLYGYLAHRVVTTCESTAKILQEIGRIPVDHCVSIPTGIDVAKIDVVPQTDQQFRQQYGIGPNDCVVGTACILRSWKGLDVLVNAAKILEHVPNLKWVIVGSGSMDKILQDQCRSLGLESKVIFTGFLEDPFPAIISMDVFALLSSANEGVSQASLQAGYFGKPLITTMVGGLHEVCLDGVTGFTVPIGSPKDVADKVLKFVEDPVMRTSFGKNAKRLVNEKFSFNKTLDAMERLYAKIGV